MARENSATERSLKMVVTYYAKLQHGETAANWDLDGIKGMERWWVA